MSGLEGARCAGRWWLFDSVDIRDHAVARNICAGCPVLAQCATVLREVQQATQGIRSSGGGPVGTWAGKLLGKSGYRHEYTLPRHGTDRGYYMHRSQGEAPCVHCKAAHTTAGRIRAKAQVNPANRTPERVEFGTQSGPESALTDRGLPITQLRT